MRSLYHRCWPVLTKKSHHYLVPCFLLVMLMACAAPVQPPPPAPQPEGPELVQPKEVLKGQTGLEAMHDYECPPGYHEIPCPRCNGTGEVLKKRWVVVGPADTDSPKRELQEYWDWCDLCEGGKRMCAPDDADKKN